MINKTDLRIIKLYSKGFTLERIAKRIGRPGDIKRIRDALIREGIIKENER